MDLKSILEIISKIIPISKDKWIRAAIVTATIVSIAFWMINRSFPTLFSEHRVMKELYRIREHAPLEFILLIFSIVPLIAIWRSIARPHQTIKEYRELKQYIQNRMKKNASMFLPYLGPDTDNSNDMGRLFVEPYLTQSRGPNRKFQVENEYTINQIFQMIVGNQYGDSESKNPVPGIFIWGTAGSGKSVLAKKIVYELSSPEVPENWLFLKRKFERTTPHARLIQWFRQLLQKIGLEYTDNDLYFPLPILVRLGTSLERGKLPKQNLIVSLLYKYGYHQFIGVAEARRFSSHRSDFMKWLHQGLVIPVFDGLDELDFATQEIFLNSLIEFLHHPDYKKNSPFVITMRSPHLVATVFSEASDMNFWHIMPFKGQQINLFVEKFFATEKGKNSARGKELQILIANTAERDPKMRMIFSDPMLLTFIAELFRKGAFPSKTDSPNIISITRIEIFAKYTEKLWEQRVKSLRMVNSPFPSAAMAAFAENLLQKREEQDYPLPGQNLSDFLTLNRILVWQTPEEKWYFIHQTFKDYFATMRISERFEELGNPNLLEKGLVDTTNLAGGKKSKDSIDNAQEFSMRWRNAITLAIEYWFYKHLKAYDEDERNNEIIRVLVQSGVSEPSFQRMARYLYDMENPFSKIWLLRIIAAIQSQSNKLDLMIILESLTQKSLNGVTGLDVTQRESTILDWIYSYYDYQTEHDPYGFWRFDLVEAGQSFPSALWEAFRDNLDNKALSQTTHELLDLLSHPLAAEILMDTMFEQKAYDVHVERTIKSMGYFSSAYLIQKGKEALIKNDDFISHNIILLLGSVGYTAASREWFNNILLNPNTYSEPIIEKVFQAYAKWGIYGVRFLQEYFIPALHYSKPDQQSLIDAYASMELEQGQLSYIVSEAMSTDTRIGIENQNIQTNDLCAKIVRKKFEGRQRELIIKYLNDKTKSYNPLSLGRRFLGWFWNNSTECLKTKSNLPPNFWNNLNSTIYSFFRNFSRPGKQIIRGHTTICNGLDDDFSKEWFSKCVTDACQENFEYAKNAFVSTSCMRSDPMEWLIDISQNMPARTYHDLEQRIYDECKRRGRKLA